ncbi:MAG: adenosylmethionine decarboxylase [Candidatus Wildermuthbacteria bacterium]|nr:adenosylmethionine decarboxylase [Candidatus Wildermuthbacteria bacterium]
MIRSRRRFKNGKNHTNVRYAGVHLIADFWHGKIIEDEKQFETLLWQAAKKARSHPLQIALHKFSPQGITGVLLLSESHIAIHTWPEIGYTAVDIFTCGKKSFPSRALKFLRKVLQPHEVMIREIRRGEAIASIS